MQSTWKTLEYLFYLGIFILLLKFTESASVNVNFSTTTERTLLRPGDVEEMKKETETETETERKSVKRTLAECDTTFSWMCLKIEFVKILEHLTEKEELRLLNGISVIKDPEAKEIKTSELMADVARSYPNDPNARLNGYIVSKINNFLQTHYLRFKLIDEKTIQHARALVEETTGRKGKVGKKGGMEMLLAAGLMMKGTLMAMGMGGIALLAGKALMTALMALTLSAVIGLKGLAGGGGKSHHYEIVTKPIYTSSHTHDDGHSSGHGMGHSASGYGGYARSLDLMNLPQSIRENQVNEI